GVPASSSPASPSTPPSRSPPSTIAASTPPSGAGPSSSPQPTIASAHIQTIQRISELHFVADGQRVATSGQGLAEEVLAGFVREVARHEEHVEAAREIDAHARADPMPRRHAHEVRGVVEE